jgi:hypothetical protein
MTDGPVRTVARGPSGTSARMRMQTPEPTRTAAAA